MCSAGLQPKCALCKNSESNTQHNVALRFSRMLIRVGQNRMYVPYMTVYLVISLPEIPYTHRINIYVVLANPTYIVSSIHNSNLSCMRSSGCEAWACCPKAQLAPQNPAPLPLPPPKHPSPNPQPPPLHPPQTLPPQPTERQQQQQQQQLHPPSSSSNNQGQPAVAFLATEQQMPL
jgi:hypothetical protein